MHRLSILRKRHFQRVSKPELCTTGWQNIGNIFDKTVLMQYCPYLIDKLTQFGRVGILTFVYTVLTCRNFIAILSSCQTVKHKLTVLQSACLASVQHYSTYMRSSHPYSCGYFLNCNRLSIFHKEIFYGRNSCNANKPSMESKP